MLAFGWVAVRVDDEVVIAVVRRLEWRPRFDVDQLASEYVVSLGRFVDIHRQDPAEDDEGFLLMPMAMTATLRAGFVTPHTPTRVPEIRKIAELANMPRRFARLVRSGDPFPVATANNAEAHEGDPRRGRRLPAAQDLAGPVFRNDA